MKRLHSIAAIASLAVLFPPAGSSFSAEKDLAKLYGTPANFGVASLSPSGKYLAFVSQIDGVDNVLSVPLDSTGKPSRFAVADSNTTQMLWHDDAQLIVQARISTKFAPSDTYYINAYRRFVLSPVQATPAVTLRTDLPNIFGPSTSVIDLDPSDPNSIYVSAMTVRGQMGAGSTAPAYYRYSVLRANLKNGGFTIVQPGEQTTASWIMDGVGNVVARVDVAAAHQDEIYVPSGTAFRKIATINDTDGHIVGLTEDGKSLAVLARRESGRLGLYRLDLADGKFGDLLFVDPNSDIRRVLYDERTFKVIGVTYDDGVLRYSYFSPERQRLQMLVEEVLPGRSANIISTSGDRTKVLVVTSGPQSPPVLQLANLKTNHIDAVAEAYPQLRGARLGSAQRYAYKTRSGIALTGLLTLPPEKEPKALPMVVLPAGGFGYSDGSFDWFAQYLTQRGYAVFQAGARDLKHLGDVASMDELGAWMNATQEDIAGGIDDLIAKGIVDPKKVCIAGADGGGYVALSAPVFLPDHYACAISLSGFSDIKVIIRNARDSSGFALNTFNSSLIRNNKEYSDEDLERYSPARRVAVIQAPMLLVAGERDQHIIQSNLMKDALTAAGKKVEMVTLKSETGSLSTAESRIAFLKAVDGFLATQIGH